MRYVFVNQAYHPDVAATAQYLRQLTEELACDGHEVTVICASQPYAGAHGAAFELHPKIKVLRVPSLFKSKGMPWQRIVNSFVTNLFMMFAMLSKRGFDEAVVLTSPPMIAWFTLFALAGSKTKRTYWVMDLNPDQAVEMGWLRRASCAHRILDAALRRVLKKFDRILVLDRYMRNRLLAKGAAPEKVEVLPLWADTEHIDVVAHEENPVRKLRGWTGRFVVMYSGNFSPCHPLDTVLEAALHLEADPTVVFCFVGNGGLRSDIMRFKELHALSNIECLDYEPQDRLGASLASADVHVVSVGQNMVGIVHPSKVYGILAAGRPYILLGPLQSSAGDLLCELQLPWQVNHGDVEGFCRALRSIRGSDAAAIAGRCRQLAMRYSLNAFVTKFLPGSALPVVPRDHRAGETRATPEEPAERPTI